MALGTRRAGRRAVSLEQAAEPGAPRCPACGQPLFVWVETRGWGVREDELIYRCENCGLAVERDAVPSAEQAAAMLNQSPLRVANAASLQAWLGAENWAAFRPGDPSPKLTPEAIELLCERSGRRLERSSQPARAGIAAMWLTLLNLLTFHRDFASEAASGRLRPGSGRGMAAFWIDAMVTVLAAVPTAALAVLLEAGAVIARSGGVIEIEAEPLPPTS
jgi:predicted RNA-binding Zn-ribbon protein involved in translation (DUF1610 family)